MRSSVTSAAELVSVDLGLGIGFVYFLHVFLNGGQFLSKVCFSVYILLIVLSVVVSTCLKTTCYVSREM